MLRLWHSLLCVGCVGWAAAGSAGVRGEHGHRHPQPSLVATGSKVTLPVARQQGRSPRPVLTFKPDGSAATVHADTATGGYYFYPDAVGDYVATGLTGLTGGGVAAWSATSFAAANDLTGRETFGDTFANGAVEHADARHSQWRVSGGVHEHGGGVHLAAGASMTTASFPAVDFMTRKRRIAFKGLQLPGVGAWAASSSVVFELAVATEDGAQSIVLAVSVNTTAAGAAAATARLYQVSQGVEQDIFTAPLPARCVHVHGHGHGGVGVGGALEIDVNTYSARLGCGEAEAEAEADLVRAGGFQLLAERGWVLPTAPHLRVACTSSSSAAASPSRSTSTAPLSLTLSHISARPAAPSNNTDLPVVLQPVSNGVDIGDGGLGPSQPLAAVGLLDVTLPPFNADASGVSDSTAAIQKAVDFGRQAYLTVFFPSGACVACCANNR